MSPDNIYKYPSCAFASCNHTGQQTPTNFQFLHLLRNCDKDTYMRASDVSCFGDRKKVGKVFSKPTCHDDICRVHFIPLDFPS